MVEALDAVVVDGAVVRARRLVKMAGVVVADHHALVVHVHLLGPGRVFRGGGCWVVRQELVSDREPGRKEASRHGG